MHTGLGHCRGDNGDGDIVNVSTLGSSSRNLGAGSVLHTGNSEKRHHRLCLPRAPVHLRGAESGAIQSHLSLEFLSWRSG